MVVAFIIRRCTFLELLPEVNQINENCELSRFFFKSQFSKLPKYTTNVFESFSDILK